MDNFIVISLVISAVISWALIMRNWRSAIYLLLCYTPITGLVVAALQPSPLGNLVRDIAIIIPLYISFFLTKRASDRMTVPAPVIIVGMVLTCIIVLEIAAQGTDNPAVGLIGAKVWLMYIPLMAVGSAFLRSYDDLRLMLRTVVVTAWLPFLVGILMWGGAIGYDYQKSVEFLYGEFARNATQGFVALKVGSSTFYRIPSTFQFVSQYASFCQFMIFPILMLIRVDSKKSWRIFGYVSLAVAIFAALTCGARGAFLFIPFIFGILVMLRVGVRGTPSMAIAIIFLACLGGSTAYFDQGAVLDHIIEMTETNGTNIVVGGFDYATEVGGIWGAGVGTGTVAARYVIDPSQMDKFFSGTIENFYAKAWIELGVFGFIAVAALLLSIVLTGLSSVRRIRDPRLRDSGIAVAGMTIFVAFISMRGWALDQDPFAYYYYLFVGFLFKLPYLNTQSVPAGQLAKARRFELAGGRLPARGLRTHLR